MTKQEEKKRHPIEEKHAQILLLFLKLEDAMQGKNTYESANHFWSDLHTLNEMNKEFLTQYFKGCSSLERFQYTELYKDIACIHLKITMP